VSLGLGLGLGLGGGGTPAPFMQVTTTDTTQVWSMRLTAGATYRYDWGDGTAIDSYVGTGADQAIAHNYGGAGTYTVRLWIDDLSKVLRFNCGANSLTGTLPSFAACTAMTSFACYSNSFSSALPSFATCTLLTSFYCNNNAFSGALPSFATCTLLVTWVCYVNAFSGTLPSFATCVSLATFGCHTNSFSGTLPSFATCTVLASFSCQANSFAAYATGAWASGCAMFRMETNALNLAAVDAILSEFTTGAGGRPAAGTLNLSGLGNAIPTPVTKAACIAALPGWTITTH